MGPQETRSDAEIARLTALLDKLQEPVDDGRTQDAAEQDAQTCNTDCKQ